MCESVMPSPPVQPISASRSGIGGVATMSLETTTSARRSSGSAAAQAFMATRAARRAASRAAVSTRSGRSRVKRSAGVPSWMRTPRLERDAAQAARERAGWTVAARGSNTPARCAVEPARRATSSGSSRSKASTPCSSHAARTPSQAPTCAGVVAVHRKPPRRKSASMPCSSQNAPIVVDGGGGRAAQPDRLLGAAARDEARQLRPPRQHHAAVAARGAAAADVALEHHDVARRVALLDPDRRPQADEAAAEDRDVGARGALERRRGRRVAERLAQPQRAVSSQRGHSADDRRRLG